MSTDASAIEQLEVNPGVTWARRFGALLGVFYLIWGPASYLQLGEVAGTAHFARALFIACLGVLLMLPYNRIRSPKAWKPCFAILALGCVAFVFTMIVSVMFDYMAAAEREERLGVPGFEGTLIFLTLMQPPAVLFQRRPDFLD
ncbi:MAG: hypothetical protein AAF212_10090 [Verrucomicrobiota bacterium]